MYKKFGIILEINNTSIKYFEKLISEFLKDLIFIEYLNIYVMKRIVYYKFIIKYEMLFYKDILFYKFIKDFKI